MIKIKLRKDLIYLLILFIVTFLSNVESIMIVYAQTGFGFYIPYIILFLKTLGTIIGGLALYLYHINSFRKKKVTNYFRLDIIHNQAILLKTQDGYLKKIILIFFAGFFDFYQFILANFYAKSSASVIIGSKIPCIITIASSLICIYALRFKIGKHHKFSLIGLSICFCLTLIIEIIYYKPEDDSIGIFLLALFSSILYHISISFTDCVERYLVDYNFLNPFKVLMLEGIIEFIMSIFYSINKDPFNELILIYKTSSTGQFILLICLLILYFLLNGTESVYKIYCNCYYSPMAKSLTQYFLNPFFNIYYLLSNKDFQNNYFHFCITELICIFVDFFCCVYNEYLILTCCGLEYNTKDEISERALLSEMDNVNIEDDDEIGNE